MAIATEQQAAKVALREALAACSGNTKDETVIAAIDKLCAINPTVAPTYADSLLEGNWLLISAPNFPQGEQLSDGKFAYSLGRVAFNMFQPVDLKLVINKVFQPVFPLEKEYQKTHDIIVEFTTIDQRFPKLSGKIYNQGVCQPINKTTLQVKFTGGALVPQDFQNLDDWRAVFSEQRPSSQISLKEKLSKSVFRLMLGLIPPQGINPNTGEIAFTMKRSPKGKLEILYLDEELRITRGERGTVLVCERC